MKRKYIWLLIVTFVSIILLLSACGASETSPTLPTTDSTTPTTTLPTTNSETPTKTQPATTVPEKPQYGGFLKLIGDLEAFDFVATGQVMGPAGQLVIETYLGEDWSRGAVGTDELKWVTNVSPAPNTCMGVLAESWEIPEPGKVVYQVRRGVHWALNTDSEASRLMNGREVTADDWIASFNYVTNPHSRIKSYAPQLFSTATMEKNGPWEVTLKTPVDPLVGWIWLALSSLFPPDIIEKYGDMQDWHNVVGTGPFMLTDLVPSSCATLTRNPDYWGKDPIGPGKGNQLPYLDGIKILAIFDVSTIAAALRTAKIDFITGVPTEESQNYMRTAADLKYITYISGNPDVIFMRLDKAELPYKDKRVRQALMMATDFDSLKNDYYQGEAEILSFPASPEAKQIYTPLEEMADPVKELYSYNPEKAKQLLAEAGYPDGFTARMIYCNIFGYADLASIYQAIWNKVGVNLELQPKELAVFTSIAYAGTYEDIILCPIIWGSVYPTCLNLLPFRDKYINDPTIEAAFREIQDHVIIDMPEADRLYKELLPYILEQAYYLPIPSPLVYSVWWPWLKNYQGETPIRFAKYWWIDRNVKEEMTGRR